MRVKSGDTWAWIFRYRAGGDPREIIDMTGCSARMQIRVREEGGGIGTGRVVASAGYLASDIPTQGEIAMDWWLGEVHVKFSPEITDTIEPGVYETDLEITWGDGTVRSSRTMPVQVQDDVTRRDSPATMTPLIRFRARRYATGAGEWYFTGDASHSGFTIDFCERTIYLTADERWYLDHNRNGYMSYVPQYFDYLTSNELAYQTSNALNYGVRRPIDEYIYQC